MYADEYIHLLNITTHIDRKPFKKYIHIQMDDNKQFTNE